MQEESQTDFSVKFSRGSISETYIERKKIIIL